ncbi:MAG: RIP metalloprotease RseP [Firmicutes bacterium]|nr:RIP metalloprotease RseP [Bacillota bacterium]
MKTFVASIIIFGILVFVHEVGHFIAARLNGIKVLELAIGFGPKIYGWHRKGTDYSLRIFPLGGFCRMFGDTPEEMNEPGSFNSKSPVRRASVLVAGSVMNLLLALLLFFIIFFFFTGVQQLDSSIIGAVIPGTPAESAGLMDGDEITAINGEPVAEWMDVVHSIERHAGEELILVVKRQEIISEIHVIAEADPESGKGKIGIAPLIKKYQFAGSLANSFGFFGMIISSLYQVITGQAPLDLVGPVGIVITIGEAAQTGFVYLIQLTGLISLSLGLVNLLPIPALDGGRLLFVLIEALRGRPLDPEKEGFIHFIGFALLILLILFITYNDLIRWDILPRR